jgi:phage tail-like protein
MDSNGTRFQLLLGERDWRRGASISTDAEHGRPSLAYDREREELTLAPLPFVFPTPSGDRAPELGDRRGVAQDRFGNVYWIDRDRRSVRAESADGRLSPFWSLDDWTCAPPRRAGSFDTAPGAGVPAAYPATMHLAGLAVTTDHYLVVGTVAPGGLLVFDLASPGPPRQSLWPAAVRFEPFDLCARAGGGAFVLDRGSPTETARIWELDHSLLVVSRRPAIAPPPGDFRPADGSPAVLCAPKAVELVDALALGGDPVALEAAPDGSVLVLDRRDGDASPRLGRFVAGEGVTGEADLSGIPGLRGHDLALLPARGAGGRRLGRAFVADARGNQSFAFDVSVRGSRLRATLVNGYYPMRLFGGKGLAGGPRNVLYHFGDDWIPLAEQRRPRYVEAGTLETRVLDGHAPDVTWHRVLVDACLPPSTAVRVSSRAANDPELLRSAVWTDEPSPYRRGDGSELPYLDAELQERYPTWELLLQGATGRYLQLRLELAGDGRTSPRVRALRATFPRFSYLERYLPAVYRSDHGSASFLERFLANVEGTATTLEDRIACAQVLFDPRTAPAEALDWLAGWFDVALDPAWSETRRRLFLRHAMEFFSRRGTPGGLELALRLTLDGCDDAEVFATSEVTRTVRIVERYRTRLTPAVVAGDPTGLELPRSGPVEQRWLPLHGVEELQRRYTALAGDGAVFTPVPPADADESARWRSFSRDVLGFVPSGDVTGWQRFLEQRYGRVGELNAAYGLAGERGLASFATVAYPADVPTGAELGDWFSFEAIARPRRLNAHRFTVLLPVDVDDDEAGDDARQIRRRDLAKRVVDLQKPAHTTFDIRFFWAAFRLGEARLGLDTLVNFGSRSPALLRPAVLGRDHVGESVLGGGPAPFLGRQRSVGRDTLADSFAPHPQETP